MAYARPFFDIPPSFRRHLPSSHAYDYAWRRYLAWQLIGFIVSEQRRLSSRGDLESAPNALKALPMLEAALSDGDVNTKAVVARVLGEFGPSAVSLVPRLMELAEGRDLVVSHEAIEALGKLGPLATNVVPVLARFTTLPDYRRGLAIRALSNIEPRGTQGK